MIKFHRENSDLKETKTNNKIDLNVSNILENWVVLSAASLETQV